MTENWPAQWTTGCSTLDETRYKTESSNYYMSCMIACGHIWAKILGKEEPELQVHDPPLAPLLFLWVLQRSKGRLARLATRMAALAGDRPLSFCPKQNQHGVHGCHWCGMIVVYLHKRVDEEPSSSYETLWPFLFGMHRFLRFWMKASLQKWISQLMTDPIIRA